VLGRLRKKTLVVVEGSLETFQPLVETTALDQLVERARLEHDDAIERRQRAQPVRRAHIDDLQVAQNPRQDVTRTARLQHRGIQLDRLSVNLRQARAYLVKRENFSADERIDDQLATLVHRLDQEMIRERDSVKVDAEPAAHFEVDQRERDRQSEAAIDHVVEEGVARV